MDFFAGSGTLGDAAARASREYVLIDNNPDAIKVMAKRLRSYKPEMINCEHLING